jgi:hypothetical protein
MLFSRADAISQALCFAGGEEFIFSAPDKAFLTVRVIHNPEKFSPKAGAAGIRCGILAGMDKKRRTCAGK